MSSRDLSLSDGQSERTLMRMAPKPRIILEHVAWNTRKCSALQRPVNRVNDVAMLRRWINGLQPGVQMRAFGFVLRACNRGFVRRAGFGCAAEPGQRIGARDVIGMVVA